MADRVLVVFGGLCGATGVALSAVATHAGGANVGTAASFLLMHAPAFLALGLAARGQALRLAGLALLLGVLTFCGDLLMRDYAGARLFPMAAPAGGVLMIFGWLAVAASALAARRTGD
ncbi:hypothetical protein MesoLjLc_56460 [Mesorhizobium sp. L-8-10]|uniref:DUF423 domain-containing protein n=1 Tax=unclassified Mesorhizobium TaxID=325217 RepID=UPI0019378EB0|nr:MULTISPECIES: DUF423 domain-containing protein [unclassified Mesorhizobium]BCH25720.1 hypothetical protein MesoLjLb_55050 [Mesorhizobium sp. L-8-3]BCH33716.1 hypothetical protein MesoLjLc_56460 [Mesorhizobium sp. L-8-10]